MGFDGVVYSDDLTMGALGDRLLMLHDALEKPREKKEIPDLAV